MADRKRTMSLNSTANRKEARNEKQAHHRDPPTKEHDPNTWLRTAWRWSRRCENTEQGNLQPRAHVCPTGLNIRETKDNLTLHFNNTRGNINQSTNHLYALKTILSNSNGSDFYLK